MLPLKNADGLVMRNSGGRIHRPNFKFNKGFGPGVVNAYLKCGRFSNMGITVGNPFTIIYWGAPSVGAGPGDYLPTFGLEGPGGGMIVMPNYRLNAVNTHALAINTGGALLTNNGISRDLISVSPVTPRIFTMFQYDGAGGVTYQLNQTRKSITLNLGSAVYANLYFGIWWFFEVTPNPKSDEILVYNRLLSGGEIDYIRNSMAGREPYSDTGLKGWYRMDQAEELDFSAAQDGSDLRAGIPDESGNNNHLEFGNVPAGTNAERVAYVNTNLLELW